MSKYAWGGNFVLRGEAFAGEYLLSKRKVESVEAGADRFNAIS